MAVNNVIRMLNLTRGLNTDGDVVADSLADNYVSNTSFEALKSNSLGRRNIIINGAMQVAQRGTSGTGITSPSYYTVDRFATILGNLGTWTQTQETDAPDGFASSLKFECTTADASPAAGDYLLISQFIEGQNLQHLKKGTSSAESVTASFWVKSNKTGTYIFELVDTDNSNRHINKSYTVDASGTWEYKTITFEGDTTGAFDNDNATSLQVNIWLGGGSDLNSGTLQTSWAAQSDINRAVGNINLADTIGNYFQLTGLQLEVGDTATPFEHRSYGEELALCQRYYIQSPDFGAQKRMLNSSGTTYAMNVSGDFPVTMRASPSMTVYGDISDGGQITLGAQGIFGTTHGFTAFTNVYNGGFLDMNYYIANAEL